MPLQQQCGRGDLLGRIRNMALQSFLLPKAPPLGQMHKQPGKAEGNGVQCSVWTSSKVRNTKGKIVPTPSQLWPSHFLRNSCGSDSLMGHRSTGNGFVLTDKLLVLNCGGTGEQPLDEPINSSPQHRFLYSQHAMDVPAVAQPFPL